MIAILFLGFLAAAASAENETPPPTFEDIKNLFEVVDSGKNDLMQDLGSIATACSSIDDNISGIKHFLLPLAGLINRDQNKVIEDYLKELKNIGHRADAALDTIEESVSLATDTTAETGRQLEALGSLDSGQDERLQNIITNVVLEKERVLASLSDVLNNNLQQFIDDIDETVLDAYTDVGSRKCETGFGNFVPGVNPVSFKTPFVTTPEVTRSIVGFASHLHSDHYEDYLPEMSLDTLIGNQTPFGFELTVDGGTDDGVAIKKVAVSWSACQNLNVKFDFLF